MCRQESSGWTDKTGRMSPRFGESTAVHITLLFLINSHCSGSTTGLPSAGDGPRRGGFVLHAMLPCKWDDPDRESDDDPHEQLTAIFKRVKAALYAWGEVMDHLT
jgi:hypothetical protein